MQFPIRVVVFCRGLSLDVANSATGDWVKSDLLASTLLGSTKRNLMKALVCTRTCGGFSVERLQLSRRYSDRSRRAG